MNEKFYLLICFIEWDDRDAQIQLIGPFDSKLIAKERFKAFMNLQRDDSDLFPIKPVTYIQQSDMYTFLKEHSEGAVVNDVYDSEFNKKDDPKATATWKVLIISSNSFIGEKASIQDIRQKDICTIYGVSKECGEWEQLKLNYKD